MKSLPFLLKPIFYLLVVFIIPDILKAQSETQQNKNFESIFYDAAVRVSAIDINKAVGIADSLYKTSTTDLHKIKSIMLKADLLEKQSKREEAIEYVLLADSIAIKTNNYEWQARIYGFLSTQYRIIGLLDQGKKYLKKGLVVSDKIEPQNSSNQYKGMVYQEMAYYAMHSEDYSEAISLLKKVPDLFGRLENEEMKHFFLGNNEVMLGRCYLKLKQYDSATYHYESALKLLNKAGASNSQWIGMVYHGLGKIALKNKNHTEALTYLHKADTIAEALNHKSLKELVFKSLSEYYRINEDLDNYTLYNAKYLKVMRGNFKEGQKAFNSEVNRIYKVQKEDFSFQYKIIIGLGTLSIFSVLLYYFSKRRQKREVKHYKTLINKLNESKKNKVFSIALKDKEDRIMLIETEKILIEKLEHFEADNYFITPNLTLSMLSTKLETNPKYLSYVINKHKNKDFNNYINELRIFYIIEKIQSNPDYLNYKISYLATECGFSSHSKFASVFKTITGLTPSSFLDQRAIVNT